MNLVHKLQRRLKINRAVRELSQLSDSILLDIGIQRSNIVDMVEKSIDLHSGHTVKVTPVHEHENAMNDYHVPHGATA